MKDAPSASRPIGSAAGLQVWHTRGQSHLARLDPISTGVASDGFWAKITGNSSEGNNQWSYSFEQVVKTSEGYGGWAALDEGITGEAAYNMTEDINSASGVQGNGIDTSSDFWGDLNFEIQPCPTNTIVWMTAVLVGEDPEYWFSYTNGIDGNCEE
jgi:hypothetical protein